MIQYDYHTRIYYHDIDQMGIVYYSRYFEYFEEARTEMLRSIGLDVTAIEAQGYYLPVITSHCDYKDGVHFEDQIVVTTSIDEIPKLRLRINYRIHRSRDSNDLVTGYTDHAFIRKSSGKPVRPPKFFLEAISNEFAKK